MQTKRYLASDAVKVYGARSTGMDNVNTSTILSPQNLFVYMLTCEDANHRWYHNVRFAFSSVASLSSPLCYYASFILLSSVFLLGLCYIISVTRGKKNERMR